MDRAFLTPLGGRGGGQERNNVGMQDEVELETEHQPCDAIEYYMELAFLDHYTQLLRDKVDRRHAANRLHLNRQH